MVQQHPVLSHVTCLLTASASPNICGRVPNLLTMAAQKVSGLGTDGDSGAGLALHHHSLDTYGGHGMVQQPPVLSHASKRHQLCPNLRQSAKLVDNGSPKSGRARHRWGLRSWFGTASSLIGHIWRTWNGSAASCTVTCLHKRHQLCPKFAAECQTC
jgi:hypothetical protein